MTDASKSKQHFGIRSHHVFFLNNVNTLQDVLSGFCSVLDHISLSVMFLLTHTISTQRFIYSCFNGAFITPLFRAHPHTAPQVEMSQLYAESQDAQDGRLLQNQTESTITFAEIRVACINMTDTLKSQMVKMLKEQIM